MPKFSETAACPAKGGFRLTCEPPAKRREARRFSAPVGRNSLPLGLPAPPLTPNIDHNAQKTTLNCRRQLHPAVIACKAKQNIPNTLKPLNPKPKTSPNLKPRNPSLLETPQVPVASTSHEVAGQGCQNACHHKPQLVIYIYIYIHIHTYTHIYIYRERDKEIRHI